MLYVDRKFKKRGDVLFELLYIGEKISQGDLCLILREKNLKLYSLRGRNHQKIENFVAKNFSEKLPIVFDGGYYIQNKKLLVSRTDYVETILSYSGAAKSSQNFWGANVHFAVLPK